MKPFEYDYYTVKLIEVIKETKEVYTFKFEKPNTDWEEGTNVHIAFPDFLKGDTSDKTKFRHLSIINLNYENFIAFTTRIIQKPSEFKSRLLNLSIGDEMIIYKFSQRMVLRRENRPVVLISMGVGLSAMKPMMDTYRQNSDGIESLTNINISHEQFVYYEYLKTLKEVEHHFIKERYKLTEMIDASYRQKNIYYVIGSDVFLTEISALLMEKGHDSKDIELDKKQNKKDEIFKAANQ